MMDNRSDYPLGEMPVLLSGDDVAHLCGISRALAFRWMARGIVPTVRIGGGRTVRVPREALMRLIQENTSGALSPAATGVRALEKV